MGSIRFEGEGGRAPDGCSSQPTGGGDRRPPASRGRRCSLSVPAPAPRISLAADNDAMMTILFLADIIGCHKAFCFSSLRRL